METTISTRPPGPTSTIRDALAAPSPSQQAVQTLTAQWYNALVAGLSLDPATFQLVQGNQLLGTTSESLWNIVDVVPPASVSNAYNPSQAVRFSGEYGKIVLNLIPQGSAQFAADLGDYYSKWSAYLSGNPSLPTGGMLELFQTWAQMHVPDPGIVAKAKADYAQILNGTVPTAQQMWLAALNTQLAYNQTIASIVGQIPSARPATVTMDSRTQSSDVQHTWAQGEVGGLFDFFNLGGGGSYDSVVSKFSSAGLTIQATFKHVLTAPLAPLSAPSSDPILSGSVPWYSSAALTMAYETKDNTLWRPGSAPSWADEFAQPGGALLRTASALVIVDGIDIGISSTATFSSDEQKTITAAANVGFWPFFEASASGGFNNHATFDASGKMTLSCSMPAGNPTVMGVIVTPITAIAATAKR